jgi:hypothetical protein
MMNSIYLNKMSVLISRFTILEMDTIIIKKMKSFHQDFTIIFIYLLKYYLKYPIQ